MTRVVLNPALTRAVLAQHANTLQTLWTPSNAKPVTYPRVASQARAARGVQRASLPLLEARITLIQ